jgi:hypothetical protein
MINLLSCLRIKIQTLVCFWALGFSIITGVLAQNEPSSPLENSSSLENSSPLEKAIERKITTKGDLTNYRYKFDHSLLYGIELGFGLTNVPECEKQSGHCYKQLASLGFTKYFGLKPPVIAFVNERTNFNYMTQMTDTNDFTGPMVSTIAFGFDVGGGFGLVSESFPYLQPKISGGVNISQYHNYDTGLVTWQFPVFYLSGGLDISLYKSLPYSLIDNYNRDGTQDVLLGFYFKRYFDRNVLKPHKERLMTYNVMEVRLTFYISSF